MRLHLWTWFLSGFVYSYRKFLTTPFSSRVGLCFRLIIRFRGLWKNTFHSAQWMIGSKHCSASETKVLNLQTSLHVASHVDKSRSSYLCHLYLIAWKRWRKHCSCHFNQQQYATKGLGWIELQLIISIQDWNMSCVLRDTNWAFIQL